GLYNTMKDYRCVIPFTTEEAKDIVKKVKKNKLYLDSLNIKYYIVVPPNAQTIYSEYLPNNIIRVGDSSRLDVAKYILKKELNFSIIDLRQTLLSKKAIGLLYYKTDTHWNALGASIAYSTIMERIKNDIPDLEI